MIKEAAVHNAWKIKEGEIYDWRTGNKVLAKDLKHSIASRDQLLKLIFNETHFKNLYGKCVYKSEEVMKNDEKLTLHHLTFFCGEQFRIVFKFYRGMYSAYSSRKDNSVIWSDNTEMVISVESDNLSATIFSSLSFFNETMEAFGSIMEKIKHYTKDFESSKSDFSSLYEDIEKIVKDCSSDLYEGVSQ